MMIHKLSPWTVLLLWSVDRQFLRDTKFHQKRLDFLSCVSIFDIRYKYVPLENTSAYRFLSKYFTRLSMLSVFHMPVRLLVGNTLSALYRLARGITSEWVSSCVVLEKFLSDLFETYLPPLTQFFRWHGWMTYPQLKYIGLWHILYCQFCFRYIPWWYQSNFDTDNHSTCHVVDVIYLVHWIDGTVCVSEVRSSSLCYNCANIPWYLLLQKRQALWDANIMWIPLLRWRTGNMWACL